VAPPLEILEYCDIKDLLSREDHYLKLLEPEYNILSKPGSPLGHKHTEDSKVKMSANRTDSIKIEVTDLETKITTSYHSIHAASKALNIPRQSFDYLASPTKISKTKTIQRPLYF
jgi:hypothetical protein